MNPLKLKDQSGNSETSKNKWIRLCTSTSYAGESRLYVERMFFRKEFPLKKHTRTLVGTLQTDKNETLNIISWILNVFKYH